MRVSSYPPVYKLRRVVAIGQKGVPYCLGDRSSSVSPKGLCRCFRRDQHLVGGGLKTGSNGPFVTKSGARGISLFAYWHRPYFQLCHWQHCSTISADAQDLWFKSVNKAYGNVPRIILCCRP